jgi:hypothetical protein
VKGSVPGHKGSVVIIKPTQKKYTPKEIYTEKVVPEAAGQSDKETISEEQITDDTEKKEINSKDNKEA